MPTTLITGANRGIGLELARHYAAQGWQVVACCRRPDAAPEMSGLAGAVRVEALEVADHGAVERLAAALDGTPIDLLINNAGIKGPEAQDFAAMDYDGWAEVFRVNAMAPLKLAQAFGPHLAASQRRLLVSISSRMGSVGLNEGANNIAYRSSKAALNMVNKCLANELAAQGITAIVFHPGWVATDMGGSQAPVTTADSVAGMTAVIDRLTPADNGLMFDYQGAVLDW